MCLPFVSVPLGGTFLGLTRNVVGYLVEVGGGTMMCCLATQNVPVVLA
jgi:hypothetical protein